MKTQDTRHDQRSQNAKNEPRDSEGRFTSKDHKSHSSSQTLHDKRSENAENEKRDSHGRFESSK